MNASTLALLALGSLVVGLVYLGFFSTRVVMLALRSGGRRDDAADADDPLADSRFAVPATVLIPLRHLGNSAVETVTCALASVYPEFEVIVVADGSGQEQVDRLKERWQLEPREVFYRQALATGAVERIYRSAADSRLLVVQKAPGGFADALNCGLNLAQYRYVIVVDAAMRFGADALMRAAAPALRDPDRVAAVGTHVERLRAVSGRRGRRWSDRFQRLGSIRALMDTRIGSHAAAVPGERDLVVVWRRDSVVQQGGFSSTAANPVADMMTRLSRPAPAAGIEGDPANGTPATDAAAPASAIDASRVVWQGDVVGTIEPLGFDEARRAAAVAQPWRPESSGESEGRVARLLQRGDAAVRAAVGLVLLGLVLALAAGAATWIDILAVVGALSFGQAAMTAAALLVRGAVPRAPRGYELLRLIAASPFELVLYRMPLAIARLSVSAPVSRRS
ncbi:MAG: glycosyltransferase family 2 protein [Vicinamibacterales bacterium]